MGNYIGTMLMRIFAKDARRDRRLLILGLDNAGKTTLLYTLKPGKVVETSTIGFNAEMLDYKNLNFAAWDCGGQEKARHIWRFYFQNAVAIIFVIDSADRERLEEAKTELHALLKEVELRGLPILVLANKQDLPNALSATELDTKLDLGNVEKDEKDIFPPSPHPWHIQPCSGLNGEGLFTGLDWLSAQLPES